MRRTELKRGRRRPRPQLGAMTARTVWVQQEGLCVCGCGGRIATGAIGYHHIFPKAKWPGLVDSLANVVGVTADCHAAHESAARRLPARCLRLRAQELLAGVDERELGRMVAYFERTYGA